MDLTSAHNRVISPVTLITILVREWRHNRPAWRGSPPVWSADGRSILAVYAKEGRANVGSFEVTSGKKLTTKGNQAVVDFARYLTRLNSCY
jgi:hypothetical protein